MLFDKKDLTNESSYEDIVNDFNESMLESSAEFADINKYLLETDIMLECMSMEGVDTSIIVVESVNDWKERIKKAFKKFIKKCKDFIDKIVGLLTGTYKTYELFIKHNERKIIVIIDRMEKPYVFEDYKWARGSGILRLNDKIEIKASQYTDIANNSLTVQNMLKEGKDKESIKNEIMKEVNIALSTDIFASVNVAVFFQQFHKTDYKYSDFSYALKMLKNKIKHDGDDDESKIKCFIKGYDNTTTITPNKEYRECSTTQLFDRVLALNTVLKGVTNVKGQYDKIYNNMIKEIESNEALDVDSINLLTDITKTTLNNTNRALQLYVDLAKESASIAYKVCVDILGKKITIEENETEEK